MTITATPKLITWVSGLTNSLPVLFMSRFFFVITVCFAVLFLGDLKGFQSLQAYVGIIRQLRLHDESRS